MPPDPGSLDILETSAGVEFPIKAVPGASRTALAGIWNGALRVALAAPAERGKANDALVRFLADALGVRRRDVTIVAGSSHPLKRVFVTGLSAARARQRLL